MLKGCLRTDAVIVGGGLTGLLLGAALTDAGLHVAILSAQAGASDVCTGAASLLCAPPLERIESVHGEAATHAFVQLLAAQLRALTAQRLPYVHPTEMYAFAPTAADLPRLLRRRELLTRLGLPVQTSPDGGGCPFPVAGSLALPGQAVVDVPRWMQCLRASILRGGGRIYPGSRVTGFSDSAVETERGTVSAPHIILATGKPLGLRSKGLLTLLETRSVLRCELETPYPVFTSQQHLDGHFTLYASGHRAWAVWFGERIGTASPQEAFSRFLHAKLPDWQPSAFLHAQEVFPLDGLPVIGLLPESRVLAACGYSGCGVLGAMNAADMLARRILGQRRPEDALFAPTRSLPPWLERQSKRRLSRILAVHRLRRGSPLCPHCTCRMRFSPPAGRWECPLCGSAYTMLGDVLNGPGMASATLSVRQRPDI